jgi:hypothetical protein
MRAISRFCQCTINIVHLYHQYSTLPIERREALRRPHRKGDNSVSRRIQRWRNVTLARPSSRARGSFAGSNAIPASGKEASIRGRRDFRVARLPGGDVAEGAEGMSPR